MRISVSVDRKAALLEGRELPARVDIEVSPSDLGDYWAALVESLDMSISPVITTYGGVIDSTPSELLRVVRSAVDAKKKSEDAERDHHISNLIQYERQVTDIECAFATPMVPEIRSVVFGGKENRHEHGTTTPYQFPGFARDLPAISCWIPDIYPDLKSRKMDADARRAGALARNKAALEAANEEAYKAALPDLQARYEIDQAVALEKAATEAKAKKEAQARAFMKRLETGMWEKETSSYNDRRYSAPWCANVSWGNGSKPVYSFGDSSGKWGKPGVMLLPCKPGDWIAWGQKDLRNPSKSEHTIGRMRENGSIETFESATEAYKAYRSVDAASVRA